MSHSDEEKYLAWLYDQVSSVRLRTRAKTYWSLLRQLYKTEFVWTVAMDENRAKDGMDLRLEFMEEDHVDYVDLDWLEAPCSVLELLIALARLLAFETGGESRKWFWELLHNLRLDGFNDAAEYNEEQVEDVLNKMMRRTYRRDGEGGLFPLRYPESDQRRVELWYQLNSYLIENY